MPLSNAKIQTSKPIDTPYKLADEKGLFLLVHPNVCAQTTTSNGLN